MSWPGDSRRCIATTKKGKACLARAMTGSDRCVVHREWAEEGHQAEQSQSGNSLVQVDPVTRLNEVIDDAFKKQSQLSVLIDLFLEQEEIKPEDLIKLLAIHNQNAGRIGRLLRDQKMLEGQAVDKLLDLLGPALDELAGEFGIDL